MGRRRRNEAEDLARRARELPPEQLGWIMTALLGNALTSIALEAALLVAVALGARRAWRVRREGGMAMARAAVSRAAVALVVVHEVHRVGARRLVLRSLRSMTERAERAPRPRVPQPGD